MLARQHGGTNQLAFLRVALLVAFCKPNVDGVSEGLTGHDLRLLVTAIQVVSSRFCSPGAATPAHILAGCDPIQGSNARLQQLLFSLYVHSSRLEFRGFSKDDVFFGTLIRNLTHARQATL